MFCISLEILQARTFLTKLLQRQEEEEGGSSFLANVQAKWAGLEDGSAVAAPHPGPTAPGMQKMPQLGSPTQTDFQRN